MARTLLDKAIDQFFTLYLIYDAFCRWDLPLLPNTKLQKLVFLSEKAMIDEREKGFNFYFIKLIHGPFSQELENDLGKLVENGLVDDKELRPTSNTKVILDDFGDMILKNASLFEKVNIVNTHFAGMRLKKLLEIVYAMPWGRGRTIADLPQRTPMLYPMKPEIVRTGFQISEQEAESLLLNFDPDAINDLSEAMRNAREGKWRSYEQVFSDL